VFFQEHFMRLFLNSCEHTSSRIPQNCKIMDARYMSKSILLFLFCLCATPIAQSQSLMMDNRIPHQIFGGVGGGILGGVAGGLTGKLLAGNNSDGFNDIASVVVGVLAGFTIGNGMGVYYMGNFDSEKGSLGWTLTGSATGLVIGVGVGANMGEALLPVVAASVTIGSMLGYNLTRRSSVAFLQPATRWNGAVASIRTQMAIPETSVALVRIHL